MRYDILNHQSAGSHHQSFLCLCTGLIADSPYTFIEGVLRDGDGEEINLVDPVIVEGTGLDRTTMLAGVDADPEIQELEDGGGGYLSNDDNCFLIDGDGDTHVVQM